MTTGQRQDLTPAEGNTVMPFRQIISTELHWLNIILGKQTPFWGLLAPGHLIFHTYNLLCVRVNIVIHIIFLLKKTNNNLKLISAVIYPIIINTSAGVDLSQNLFSQALFSFVYKMPWSST